MGVLLFLMLFDRPLNVALKVPLSELSLTRNISVAISDNGDILLGGKNDKKLCFLSNKGQLITITGRNGVGPGEFQDLSAVYWRKDLLAFQVYDSKNLRISSWSPQGKLLNDYSVTQKMVQPHFQGEQVYYLLDTFGEKGSNPTLYFTSTPVKEDRKIIWSHGELETPFGIHEQVGGGVFSAWLSWDPYPVLGVGKEFIAVGHTETNQVTLYATSTHKEIGKLTVPFVRPRVTEEDVKIELENVPREFVGFIKKFMKKPAHWPAYFDLIVDDNKIWVIGIRPTPDKPYPFRVFDIHGRLINEGNLPQKPLLIENNKVVFVDTDEDDDEFLIIASML